MLKIPLIENWLTYKTISFLTSFNCSDELREHLKNAPKMIMAQTQQMSSDSSSDSSDGTDSSDSSDDSSDIDESSSGECLCY